ncbi:MAG: YqgE/AlgH family protein [Cyclobacteriaceae bacterium]|nr:YqgE/AlgH family protein [Cyclobacteriaceae bacterium]
MEFFKYNSKLEPAKGRFLISEPYLSDPNFERTIILLCDHDADGSFGFIVNKASEAKVCDVVDELRGFQGLAYVGGPVQQDTLHYLHRLEDLEDAVPVGPGIYWGGNFEELKIRIEQDEIAPADIRFFLGYSGWSPGQIEEELQQDSWIVSDLVTPELIFEASPDKLWQEVLKRMGGKFSMISNYPVDPRMN